MRRRLVMLGVLAGSCVGLVTFLLGMATGPASGQTRAKAAPKVTVIAVTAGKPVELGFKLSKWSSLPAGTVTFKVTNRGYAIARLQDLHERRRRAAPRTRASAR